MKNVRRNKNEVSNPQLHIGVESFPELTRETSHFVSMSCQRHRVCYERINVEHLGEKAAEEKRISNFLQ